jgi:hypothetical protein
MSASKRLRGVVAVLALGSLVLVLAGGVATASSTPTTTAPTTNPWVGVAQTVVAATSATGQISGEPRVFTQFSANGQGPHTLKVPMSPTGFRNLSGLGLPPIIDGYALWNLHLSGPTQQRTVAHFPKDKLPIQVSAVYELNGKTMKAKNIVGKSGELKVTYVLDNTTTKNTKVQFKNALGAEQTKTVKAPIPIAAILDVTIPAAFTNLEAPGAGTSGNGNGTSTASWTVFLFDPLGGVKQSITYKAHVTSASVPSATLEAQVLPPHNNTKPLPTVPVPGAPAVPTVTLGGRLAALQKRFQAKLRDLSAKASALLGRFQAVAVPAADSVSTKAAQLAANLPTYSATASNVSTAAANVSTNLAQDAVDAADIAGRASGLASDLRLASADAADAASGVADVRTSLESLSPAVKRTGAYRAAHQKLVDLQVRLIAHAARLAVSAVNSRVLQVHMIAHSARLALRAGAARALSAAAATASTGLAGSVTDASKLSANAAQTAATIADVTVHSTGRHSSKTIQPKQVGGGARLDAAVGQLDAAITGTATKVDNEYAYLTALNQRATETQLPAGNAKGATTEAGAYVYSISGANNTAHQVHVAAFAGGFALVLGICFGISLFRIRRGLPSSLAPPKSAPATAKG